MSEKNPMKPNKPAPAEQDAIERHRETQEKHLPIEFAGMAADVLSISVKHEDAGVGGLCCSDHWARMIQASPRGF